MKIQYFIHINKEFNPYEEYIDHVKKLHPQAKITTDKNLFNYRFCPVLDKYFRNTKMILCLRNPLDNILSIYRTNFNKVAFSSKQGALHRQFLSPSAVNCQQNTGNSPQ